MSNIGQRNPRWRDYWQSKSIDRLRMAQQALPDDFKEFLRLLNEADIEYLLIGGYAVAYHGYPRATADMDIWVAISPSNALKLVDVFNRFGMHDDNLTAALFKEKGKIIRMGVPPMRIEVLTQIDGVDFEECYAERITTEIDNQTVHIISREHLRKNKKASGRHKDLDDIENLPE